MFTQKSKRCYTDKLVEIKKLKWVSTITDRRVRSSVINPINMKIINIQRMQKVFSEIWGAYLSFHCERSSQSLNESNIEQGVYIRVAE